MVCIFFVVGLGKRTGRSVIKFLKCPARFGICLVSERQVRPDTIPVVSPERQFMVGDLENYELQIQASILDNH